VPPAPDCTTPIPVALGAKITGRIDATTCQNVPGFRVATQYAITAGAPTSYAVRLTSSVPTALVPLTIAGSLYVLPQSDTATTAIIVVPAGTYGLLVTAPSQTPGTYTLATARDPDPLMICAPTIVTRGVAFNTALTAGCTTREIRLLPMLRAAQTFRATVSTPGRTITIELRSATNGALLQEYVANAGHPTVSITYTNTLRDQGVFLRIRGGRSSNDLLPVTIAP
jgi:hypothetical protein